MSNSLERQRFEAAFAKRLGKTPAEFVQQKLHSGSKVADIRYQYEIMAVEIARQSGCRKQNFSLYYPPSAPLRPERPENQERPPVTVQKKQFHKLVRDRIPEIIEADGKTCVWETLSDEELLQNKTSNIDEIMPLKATVETRNTAVRCLAEALVCFAKSTKENSIDCLCMYAGLKNWGNRFSEETPYRFPLLSFYLEHAFKE